MALLSRESLLAGGKSCSSSRTRRCPEPVTTEPLTTVLILNGPNLGRLGSREPEIYGTATLDDVAAACTSVGAELGLKVDLRQTDDEAELIACGYEAADQRIPVMINPAAFPRYS